MKTSILNLKTKSIVKPPQILRLLGVWSECELYKHFFLEYDFVFESIVYILSNKAAAAKVYYDAFDMIMKVCEYGMSDESLLLFDVTTTIKKYVKDDLLYTEKQGIRDLEPQKYSKIGEMLVNKHIESIIDGVSFLSSALDSKGLISIR